MIGTLRVNKYEFSVYDMWPRSSLNSHTFARLKQIINS